VAFGRQREYTIQPVEGLQRGTQIVLELRDDAEEFADEQNIRRIVQEYSNFVPFPILINTEKVNTIQAIWTRNKNEITEEEYKEFYKFIAHAFDEPTYRLHFSVDVPLMVNALLFVPTDNMERFGFGRMDPGVNLYSRKVLIQPHSEYILPEWLRFVKGVIDCEDLPLNISRETFQDDALVRKLKKVMTSRFLKFLGEQAKSDPEKYKKFWQTFGIFLKEGVASDFEYRNEIIPLLRFESSTMEPGTLVSLKDYVERMRPDQKDIYYLNGPSREVIENGPYIEALRKRNLEVLLVFEPVDDFVLTNIHEFEDKKIISADQGDLQLPDVPEERAETEVQQEKLNRDEAESLSGWIKGILGERVKAVRPSRRLVDSPAMVVMQDAGMTAQMQRIMQAMNQEMFQSNNNQALEINPSHPIFVQIARRKQENPDDPFLKLAVEQIYENALAAAGMVQDPRMMVRRNYEILEKALKA
jgi:TNF receptor-associated protein 1